MKKQHKILIDSLAYELKSGTRKIDQRFKQLEEELQQLIEKQHRTPQHLLSQKTEGVTRRI